MIPRISKLAPGVKQYLIVTGNYWAFTLTDGALRMLVVLHFHHLGYGALEIALLFLFYEIFGIITNLVGGWLGARIGLNHTMNLGLGLQILALSMLLLPNAYLTVPWVMTAQALSGIAKDLNKMSAKSAIKTLIPKDQSNALFQWVAVLTGSKNALKGAGFFIGGWLLAFHGFRFAIFSMVAVLMVVWLASLFTLKADLGKAARKPRFKQLFSRASEINQLAAARLFLFGARDIWFVIALPVFLSTQMGWSPMAVGTLLALWIIGYGIVQASAPAAIKFTEKPGREQELLTSYGSILMAAVTLMTIGFYLFPENMYFLIGGLLVFGALFAINSAIHSYLIVAYADTTQVSVDVGFYYMANAMGRLLGTVFSGWIYQRYGLLECLIGAVLMTAIATVLAYGLPEPGGSGSSES